MNQIFVIATYENGGEAQYFCGLQGWSQLPENAIHYPTRQAAEDTMRAIRNVEKLKVEEL